jgi:hypothetical protein
MIFLVYFGLAFFVLPGVPAFAALFAAIFFTAFFYLDSKQLINLIKFRREFKKLERQM